MRKIDKLVIHCSATPAGREFTVADITAWHRERGFSTIGYHYVIHLDGRVSLGRPEKQVGAHVAGHNARSIGICYIGGVDANRSTLARDTRTPEQRRAMADLLLDLTKRFPGAEVLGHRDFPKVAKACPSFDVKSWWARVLASRTSPTKDT